MATAKKTPTPESKLKAVSSKALVKPEVAAKTKAGTVKKGSQEVKQAALKAGPAVKTTKVAVEIGATADSMKKGAGTKKPEGVGKRGLKAAPQQATVEPVFIPVPASPADTRKVSTPKIQPAAPEANTPKPAVAPPTFPAGHFEAALQAVKEGKAIELIFRDADADPPRTFEPRQLIFDTLTQAWFVWGWDRRYNAERHHRLDQLAEINIVDGPGRSAQGPYKEGTPPNLIGGWLGGEPIRVKAALQKQWIFAVKQAPPAFPEFKIEDGEDGKATVSFVATDLRAIARWCLQFGEGIQVLEPQRLVDRVKQVGIAWSGKPAPAAAPPPPVPRPQPQPVPRPEYKPEHKSEHRRDHGKDRDESPKKRPGIEIRIEKL